MFHLKVIKGAPGPGNSLDRQDLFHCVLAVISDVVVILKFFSELDLVDGIPQALFDVVLLVGVAAAQTLFGARTYLAHR